MEMIAKNESKDLHDETATTSIMKREDNYILESNRLSQNQKLGDQSEQN